MNSRTIFGICVFSCFLMISMPLIPTVQSIEAENVVKSVIEEKFGVNKIDMGVFINILTLFLRLFIKFLEIEFIVGYIWGFVYSITLWGSYVGDTHGAFFVGLLYGFINGFANVGMVLGALFIVYGFHPIYGILISIRAAISMIEEVLELLPNAIEILLSNIPTFQKLIEFLEDIFNELFPSYQANIT